CSHVPRCLERCAQIAWQFRLNEILGLSLPLRACCSHIPRCLERCAQIAWQFRLSEILGLSFPLRAMRREMYGGNTAGMSHWSRCLVH
ncbi:hypothetical protein P5673_032084, partial [Acropora cervicornis]